jgi:hypothetical protein
MASLAPTSFISAPPESIYTDITAIFAAIQSHAYAHGYAIFTRDRNHIELHILATAQANTKLRAGALAYTRQNSVQMQLQRSMIAR